MLYLEDFLEVIENLPMEMRERFTDMREADLEVQNATDTLEDRTKQFFKKCVQTTAKKEWKDDQFSKIKEDYKKAVEQADEKVQLASQIYDMVDRHLRKLDIELNKFKMELEADNAGITEMLEKRSLELDNVPKENNPPTKRKYATQQNMTIPVEPKKQAIRIPTTVQHETTSNTQDSLDFSEPSSPSSLNNGSSSLSYSLGHVGAQSNAAIRAAASQAIAATQHTMNQGRRTTSLKASIEATKKNDQWPALSESLSSSSQSTADNSHNSRSQRVKKHTQKAEELIKAQQAKKHAHTTTTQISQSGSVESPLANEVVEESTVATDWSFDPNEPRYCLCNQVSYGEMVGCDNKDCPVEWFHYGCVGLTSAPKGKWYCPQCTATMKRRGRR